MQSSYSKLSTILILGPMAISIALAMDVYIPAIPDLARHFHVSPSAMQYTLSVFLFVSGLMQLVLGPLADRFGRRVVSFFSIGIFAIGSMLSACAHSLDTLIIYRSIQAIGASGMIAASFAVVRDRFSGRESAQVYSYLNGMISFSPMFAPSIGGFLDVYYGWQATFYFLLGIAALSFCCVFWGLAKETRYAHQGTLDTKFWHDYARIMRHPIFWKYNYAGAIGLSYLFIFFSISPYLIIVQLGISELHYGFYFCFMGASVFIGSMLSSEGVKRIGVDQTVILGYGLSFVGGILMLCWFYSLGLTLYGFILPMVLIGIGGTMGMGAGGGGAMEPFGHIAGSAAALGGATRFLFAATLGALVVPNHVVSTLPLAYPAVILPVMGIVLHRALGRIESS